MIKLAKWQIAALIFLFVQPCAILAQEIKPLSLAEAVELAAKNNRQLQAAQRQTDAARSVVEQARGALMPRVDIIEGFNYSDKPTLVFSNRLDQGTFRQENFAINCSTIRRRLPI